MPVIKNGDKKNINLFLLGYTKVTKRCSNAVRWCYGVNSPCGEEDSGCDQVPCRVKAVTAVVTGGHIQKHRKTAARKWNCHQIGFLLIKANVQCFCFCYKRKWPNNGAQWPLTLTAPQTKSSRNTRFAFKTSNIFINFNSLSSECCYMQCKNITSFHWKSQPFLSWLLHTVCANNQTRDSLFVRLRKFFWGSIFSQISLNMNALPVRPRRLLFQTHPLGNTGWSV